MATVDLATGINDAKHYSRHGATNVPYVVEATLDYASALTEKGSALAAADVIQLIDIPAETMVLNAGAEVTTAANSTTLTVDVGVTGVDTDQFVDGFDGKSSAGTHAQNPAAFQPVIVGASADTLDVTFATLTGTLSTGKLRVYAVLCDISAKKAPGVAQFDATA
jgi:hypothetical protein